MCSVAHAGSGQITIGVGFSLRRTAGTRLEDELNRAREKARTHQWTRIASGLRSESRAIYPLDFKLNPLLEQDVLVVLWYEDSMIATSAVQAGLENGRRVIIAWMNDVPMSPLLLEMQKLGAIVVTGDALNRTFEQVESVRP